MRFCLQLPAAVSRRPAICGEVTDFGEGKTTFKFYDSCSFELTLLNHKISLSLTISNIPKIPKVLYKIQDYKKITILIQ